MVLNLGTNPNNGNPDLSEKKPSKKSGHKCECGADLIERQSKNDPKKYGMDVLIFLSVKILIFHKLMEVWKKQKVSKEPERNDLTYNLSLND